MIEPTIIEMPSRRDPASGYLVTWYAPQDPRNACTCRGFVCRGKCAHLTDADKVMGSTQTG